MGMIDGAARIGKVMKHAIDTFIGVIIETRKDYNQTVFLYNPSGDDSVPCKNDKVIILKVDGTGNFIGAGVLTESQGAKPGEKIFFGRDADGKITCKLSMLNSGNIEVAADGDISVKADGDLTAEASGKMTLTITGDITIEGSGAINETAAGDITREAAGKYTIHAVQIAIEGDTEIILQTIGSAAWCPNGVTNCFICGAPHGGPQMGIVGLKGA